MARRAAISLVMAGVVVGTWSLSAGVPFTSATGVGPTIVLGAPSGVTVPVRAGTTSTDAYKGFHIHLSAVTSAAVTLTAISGSATGGTLDTGGLFCTTQVPGPHEVNYGCVPLSGQSTTAAGLLATMPLQSTGDGCIRVRLVDLLATDPNAIVSDTYTIDQNTNTPQENSVSAVYADVLVGAGSAAACAGLGSVGGRAEDPRAPQVIAGSGGRPFAVGAFAFAALFAVIGTGWAARRRRAR